MTDRLRCLILDANPVVRLGVRAAIGELCEVEEAADRREGVQLLTGATFDAAIVELGTRAGGRAEIATVKALLRAQRSLGVIAYGEPAAALLAVEALAAGALGYVSRCSPPAILADAVRAVAESETFLDPRLTVAAAPVTPRQRQILQLLADGHSTEATARRLGLSAETVKTHSKRIFDRLEAHDRTHAVAIALRSSLID